MDESSAIIEQILREDELQNNTDGNRIEDTWKTVSYRKKSSKPSQQENSIADRRPNRGSTVGNVFRSIKQHSEDQSRGILEAQIASSSAAAGGFDGSKRHSHEDDDSDAEALVAADTEVKEVKQKKPKVTVAEAAAKIDAGDLGAFLAEITTSYEKQQDKQLMRFADYFGRTFAGVSSSQFPWLKTFRESSVSKMVDIPISHISEDVYKTSVDWLSQRSFDALGSFVLWSLESIFTDLKSHQGAVKGSKKAVQLAPSKSLASQGDLAVGLHMWVHVLLPMLSGKSSCNPQARDMILQLVERILSSPKARTILINGAVRKGERVVPPSALELLTRVTYPVPSVRVKATERFEAVYPTLKEVSFTGSPRSKAMKQVAQQMLNLAVKAAGEGIPDLSREASDIFIWCLNQNLECYKQWDMFYLDNLEASVVILRKLSEEWKEYSDKHPMCDAFRETLKSFRQKNENELVQTEDAARSALLKDADKSCKVVLGRLSRSHGCLKGFFFVSVALAVAATVVSQNPESLDVKKLIEMFSSP